MVGRNVVFKPRTENIHGNNIPVSEEVILENVSMASVGRGGRVRVRLGRGWEMREQKRPEQTMQ